MSVTIAEARAIIERMDAVQDMSAFDEREERGEELRAIDEQLGEWCGEGQAREDLRATADAIGSDYICALEEGSILAWGADRVICRQIVIISEPEE